MVRRKQQNRDARQCEFLFEDFETKKFHYAATKLSAEKDGKIAELEKKLGDADGNVKELAAKDGKIAELEKKLGETTAALDVYVKQYGCMPYNALEGQAATTTGNVPNAEQEYATELRKANVAPGE